jgi:predicted GIY-YIG superfamily endonuclease
MRARDGEVDYARVASDVLGIRNASPDLARRLVAQALVIEDRHEHWRSLGERVCAEAPETPGVYVLVDEADSALYVGKANNLRRRLRAHFSERRWRAVQPALARAANARWHDVGSELEALLLEARLIAELRPVANVQRAAPELSTRAIPRPLMRDVIVVVPSVEPDSVELVAARVDGGCVVQRTRRDGADLAVHGRRLWRFFASADRRLPYASRFDRLAPIVFSWLAGRGASASRLDPHDDAGPRDLCARLRVLIGDDALFVERIVVVDSKIRRPRTRP